MQASERREPLITSLMGAIRAVWKAVHAICPSRGAEFLSSHRGQTRKATRRFPQVALHGGKTCQGRG